MHEGTILLSALHPGPYTQNLTLSLDPGTQDLGTEAMAVADFKLRTSPAAAFLQTVRLYWALGPWGLGLKTFG